MNYLVSGKVPKRNGNAHPNIQPQDVYACADGDVILVVGNDGQFARLCGVLERPDLAQDERFRSNAGRVRNNAALTPLIAAILGDARARALGRGLRACRRAVRSDQLGAGSARRHPGETSRHAD